MSIVDDRRSHDPPPYLLHKKSAVLPPPCPKYGRRQPAVPPMTPGMWCCVVLYFQQFKLFVHIRVA